MVIIHGLLGNNHLPIPMGPQGNSEPSNEGLFIYLSLVTRITR